MGNIKETIDKEFKNIEHMDIYLYVNLTTDLLFLTDKKKDCEDSFVLFSKKKKKYSKGMLIDIIKAFNIDTIIFPNRNVYNLSAYLPRRELAQKDIMKEYMALYDKKLIFLLKTTKKAIYLKLLSKKKFIVLAKPNNLDIDILNTEIDGHTYIPAFIDSNFMRIFLDENTAISTKEYKPYLISCKTLSKIAKKKNLDIYLNPSDYKIAGKSFRYIITRELIDYIKKLKE